VTIPRKFEPFCMAGTRNTCTISMIFFEICSIHPKTDFVHLSSILNEYFLSYELLNS
jgi:hypothetical protein